MRTGDYRLTLLALAGGLILGAVLVYAAFGDALAARDRSLAEWRDLARDDREASQTARDIGLAEAKTWRAAMEEVREGYSRVRERLHEREMQLASAADTIVWLGAVILALTLGAAVIIFRDANAKSTETIKNAVALTPPEMVKSFLATYFDIGRIVLPDRPQKPDGLDRPKNPGHRRGNWRRRFQRNRTAGELGHDRPDSRRE
ncbi:MAG: hypothetical protein LBE84_06055 [Planctomycetota bacterium]|jgi:hypothetical protein|nr:hypothetical protein [Planctomycetota bacterium]